MVKVHLEGIYGMKELIDGLTLGTGDSYATYVENPETNETALHQFVLGDDDAHLLADIASDPYVRSDTIPVKDFVKVYAWVDAPLSEEQLLRLADWYIAQRGERVAGDGVHGCRQLLPSQHHEG